MNETIEPPKPNGNAREGAAPSYSALDQAGDEQLRLEFTEARDADGLSNTSLARVLGVGKGSLSEWLNAKYRGDTPALEQKIRDWLEARARKGMPRSPDFFDTATARRIITTLEYTRDTGDMAIVSGDAGVGKSTAARYYQRTVPHVTVVTITPVASSAQAVMHRLAEALDLPIGGNLVRLQGFLCHELRRHRSLVIIDEAQHLRTRALEQLRSLHDATKCGLVLMGNTLLPGRIQGGTRSAEFAQIFSRIGLRCRLGRSQAADIEAQIEAWQITDPSAKRSLMAIGKHHGGMRAVDKTMRIASLLAEKSEGGVVSSTHITRAWENIGA